VIHDHVLGFQLWSRRAYDRHDFHEWLVIQNSGLRKQPDVDVSKRLAVFVNLVIPFYLDSSYKG